MENKETNKVLFLVQNQTDYVFDKQFDLFQLLHLIYNMYNNFLGIFFIFFLVVRPPQPPAQLCAFIRSSNSLLDYASHLLYSFYSYESVEIEM